MDQVLTKWYFYTISWFTKTDERRKKEHSFDKTEDKWDSERFLLCGFMSVGVKLRWGQKKSILGEECRNLPFGLYSKQSVRKAKILLEYSVRRWLRNYYLKWNVWLISSPKARVAWFRELKKALAYQHVAQFPYLDFLKSEKLKLRLLI